jgi:hypothetical protein
VKLFLDSSVLLAAAGSAGPWPPRAEEALGRMGFRAAREVCGCSPPRRATAKVPLPPGWCDGVVRWGGAMGWCDGVVRWGAAMGCVAMRCGWVAFRSAPTGHGIPAQGETLGTLPTQPMRSEGTPHRCVGQALEGCVSGASSAGPWPPRARPGRLRWEGRAGMADSFARQGESEARTDGGP